MTFNYLEEEDRAAFGRAIRRVLDFSSRHIWLYNINRLNIQSFNAS